MPRDTTDEGHLVQQRLRIMIYLALGSVSPLHVSAQDDSPAKVKQRPAESRQASEGDDAGAKSPDGATARTKPLSRSKSARKKADRASATKKGAAKPTGLDLGKPVVCKSIDGFENFEPLRGAAQTSDEKLLIYIRPTGYQVEKVAKGYQAHLIADGEVRKRGEKTILRQKKKALDFKTVYSNPHEVIFLKQSVSLKGLAPGEYDFTIILHDEIAKGAPATQVVKFKVIPSLDPRKAEAEARRREPHELDKLYAPFMDFDVPSDDDDE